MVGNCVEMDVVKDRAIERPRVKGQVLLCLCWKPRSFPAKREGVQSQVQTPWLFAQQRHARSAESCRSRTGVQPVHRASAEIPAGGSSTHARTPAGPLRSLIE